MSALWLDLVVDVGNSRTKAALFKGGRLLDSVVMANGDRDLLVGFLGDRRPEASIVANVADADGDWIDHIMGLAPALVVTGRTGTPLRMAYADTGTLGADRLANAVAAWCMMPSRNSLVVDLGTCITYDLVEADGSYRGGAISPGMRLRARAMNAYSARLPLVEPGDLVPMIGDSTLSSLSSGVHHGILGELQGFIASFRQQYEDLGVILTGGDALRFANALKSGIFAHPFLTLLGLNAILDHNRSIPGVDPGAFPIDGGGPGPAG